MKRNLVKKAVLPVTIATLLTASISCASPAEKNKSEDVTYEKKIDTSYPGKTKFSDVAEDDWYYEVVKKWMDIGIIKGFPDNSFKPDDPISREDAMTILFRYIESSNRRKPTQDIEVLTKYTDGKDVSEYAKEALNYLIHIDKVKGFPDKSLKPQSNITRADSTIIMTPFSGEWVMTEEYIARFKDMNHLDFDSAERHYADSAVQDALHLDIIKGRTEDMFYPDESITRAEFIKLLDNVAEKYKESVPGSLNTFLMEVLGESFDIENQESLEKFSKYGDIILQTDEFWGINRIIIQLREDSPLNPEELKKIKEDSIAKDLDIRIAYKEEIDPFKIEKDNISKIYYIKSGINGKTEIKDTKKFDEIFNKLMSFEVSKIDDSEGILGFTHAIEIELKDSGKLLTYVPRENYIEVESKKYVTEKEGYTVMDWESFFEDLI